MAGRATLAALPTELLLDVCTLAAQGDPLVLLRLSMVCWRLHSVLAAHSAASVWRTAAVALSTSLGSRPPTTLKAAVVGDVRVLRLLLRARAGGLAAKAHALAAAVACGRAAAVRVLVASGAPLDNTPRGGSGTLLHLAVWRRHLEVVSALLEHSVGGKTDPRPLRRRRKGRRNRPDRRMLWINAIDARGLTPLDLAMRLDYADYMDEAAVMGEMLDRGAVTTDRQRMVFAATIARRPELLRQACKGVDVNEIVRYSGDRPTHTAARGNCVDELKILIEHGADVFLPQPPAHREYLSHSLDYNRTADPPSFGSDVFDIAARSGSVDVCRLLIEHGVSYRNEPLDKISQRTDHLLEHRQLLHFELLLDAGCRLCPFGGDVFKAMELAYMGNISRKDIYRMLDLVYKMLSAGATLAKPKVKEDGGRLKCFELCDELLEPEIRDHLIELGAPFTRQQRRPCSDIWEHSRRVRCDWTSPQYDIRTWWAPSPPSWGNGANADWGDAPAGDWGDWG
ncbi:hypothetical protein HK105_207386 [Polyrhizophydium stewartii]|uniref:Ankyrin repeat protein n=1 Tax=Polyrhizophydium stewartii TaxID=2732419 RepID=A0ABR4N0U8_9FUNG